MAKEKKQPVMNKCAEDRTLYDEWRIQERVEHLNQLCQKVAGMNGYEMIATEIKSQFDFKENEISKEELAQILEKESKKLMLHNSTWDNLRQGSFPYKKETRDYFSEKFGMDFYDFMIYVNNGEEDEYPCDPTYPADYINEHIVNNDVIFYYDPQDVCKFLGITEEEWDKALKNENRICFAFADYLEKYFDFIPGRLSQRIDPIIAGIHERTHAFSPPPLIQERIEKEELKKWRKIQDNLCELSSSCIVIHRPHEEPYIIQDFVVLSKIIEMIPQELLKQAIEEETLNKDWTTSYVWDDTIGPPHGRYHKYKKVPNEYGRYDYIEDGVRAWVKPTAENDTSDEK